MRGFVADDPSAEGLAETLVAETHTEDRHLSAELLDRIVGDARIVGSAGPWRDDDAVVLRQLTDAHLVVAEDRRLHPELAEVLNEVVRERVVVVDDREPGRWRVRHHMSSAISIALNMAPAFSSVSSNARSGRESATTPAPAWT